MAQELTQYILNASRIYCDVSWDQIWSFKQEKQKYKVGNTLSLINVSFRLRRT